MKCKTIKIEKEKIIVSIKFFIIILAISIFACQPYLNQKNIYAHDLGYHLNRIIQVSRNIDMKVIPGFIHSGLLNNLGYANSIFYPEIFLYIPAILMLVFNIHIFTAYRIFLVIITFFSFLITYISVKRIFKSKEIAWISSLLYVFSLYRLTDIYVRGALGEILSFIFLPLIFWGLYEIVFGENRKWWIISLGICGIAWSHILTLIIICPVIIFFCLFNIKEIIQNKNKFINLCFAGILSLTLSSSVIFPILEQKCNDKFYIDEKSLVTSQTIKMRANSVGMLLGSSLNTGDAINSSINDKEMSEGIGIILIILAGLSCFRKIKYKENKFEMQILLIGIIILLMTTKLFPWEKFSFLKIIQFPFRLNIIPTICFAMIGSKNFYEIVNNKKDMIIILTLGILITSGYVLDSVKVNVKSEQYPTFESIISGINETGNSEYLPINSDLESSTLYNIKNREKNFEFTQTGSKIEFQYDEKDIPMEINVPLIYYKGYTAKLVDNKNNEFVLDVTKNNENGQVLVRSDEVLNGRIIVEYKMTKIQLFSYIITIFSAFTLLGIMFNLFRKSKIVWRGQR